MARFDIIYFLGRGWGGRKGMLMVRSVVRCRDVRCAIGGNIDICRSASSSVVVIGLLVVERGERGVERWHGQARDACILDRDK